MQARVSPQELKFANDYFMGLGQLYQDQVLQHLPPNYNSLVRGDGGVGEGWEGVWKRVDGREQQ